MNAILGLPPSFVGIWAGSDAIVNERGSVAIGATIYLVIFFGWWLLYGYGCALFRRKTPIRWRSFWQISIVYNLAIFGSWTVYGLMYPDPSPLVTLTPSAGLNMVIQLSLFWGWPLLTAFLSRVILAGDEEQFQNSTLVSET